LSARTREKGDATHAAIWRAWSTIAFQWVIDNWSHPDGSLGPVAGDAINTMMLACELGTAAVAFQPQLSATQLDPFRNLVHQAAQFLIDGTHIHYYSNGNINLGYCELLYL
jgi:hypothetical protein